MSHTDRIWDAKYEERRSRHVAPSREWFRVLSH